MSGDNHVVKRGKLNEVDVDAVCMWYDNATFLFLSHFQKIGTVVEVVKDSTSSGRTVYSTKCLLGKDETEVHVIARTIASTLLEGKTSEHKMYLALGLKSHSLKSLPHIIDFVRSL